MPACRLSIVSISSTLMPAVRDRYVITPGSMSPERVPITRPSIGVNPIDVSTGRPPTIADADAPLPKCSTIWLSEPSGTSRNAAACSLTYWCEVP